MRRTIKFSCLVSLFGVDLAAAAATDVPGRLASPDEASRVYGAACSTLASGSRTVCSSTCGTATDVNWTGGPGGADFHAVPCVATKPFCTDLQLNSGANCAGS